MKNEIKFKKKNSFMALEFHGSKTSVPIPHPICFCVPKAKARPDEIYLGVEFHDSFLVTLFYSRVGSMFWTPKRDNWEKSSERGTYNIHIYT